MRSSASPLRCVIVDDSTPFLQAATMLLERDGFAVVGVASTVAEALQRVAELRPDVALVDVYLGAESGFDLAQQLDLAGWSSQLSVILTSTHAADEFGDMISEAPVVGFLPKETLSTHAIRHLLAECGADQGSDRLTE
jgi:DNA-binding NarL/FixJ family response regulator